MGPSNAGTDGSVRFVHAADLHLDAPFKGIDASDARVRDALVASTLGALDVVVDTCIARDVDFLVLAGDVYNSAERSLRAEFAFRDACARLDEAGIAVFIARGNHDPASSRGAGLAMPPNVRFFSEREVERIVFEREGEPVCSLYGRSFRTAAETSDLALEYARSLEDRLAVGVLHANVGGRVGHEPYAPCSVEDLRAAGMDYWALGHIHKPEVLSEDPAIVYSGCTQGLHPGEGGPRGCVLVSLSSDGAVLETVSTAQLVWDERAVAAESLTSVEDVFEAAMRAVSDAADASGGLPVILRLAAVGRSEVNRQLTRPGVLDDLLGELRAAALGHEPWVWIDRLIDRTRPPLDLDVLRTGTDFAADLVHLADTVLEHDGATTLVDEVARAALGALDGRDVPAFDAGDVVARARDLALDRLLAGERR